MTLGELHEQLTTAGLPVRGLSRNEDSPVDVDWLTPPTPQQETQAQTIVGGADWTKMHPKALLPLVTELLVFIDMPATQPPWAKRLAKLAALAVAQAMQSDPKLARKVGEAIDGDE